MEDSLALFRRGGFHPRADRRAASGEVKRSLNAALSFPGRLDRVSVPPAANAPGAPNGAPADLAFGHSGHADAANQCPARSASEGDLRGHAVGLMKRRGRHGLRRRCDGQGKGTSSDQSDHWFAPCFRLKGHCAFRQWAKAWRATPRAALIQTTKNDLEHRSPKPGGPESLTPANTSRHFGANEPGSRSGCFLSQ